MEDFMKKKISMRDFFILATYLIEEMKLKINI